jgi:hypothetical protein
MIEELDRAERVPGMMVLAKGAIRRAATRAKHNGYCLAEVRRMKRAHVLAAAKVAKAMQEDAVKDAFDRLADAQGVPTTIRGGRRYIRLLKYLETDASGGSLPRQADQVAYLVETGRPADKFARMIEQEGLRVSMRKRIKRR